MNKRKNVVRPSFVRKALVYFLILLLALELVSAVFITIFAYRFRSDKMREYEMYYDNMHEKIITCVSNFYKDSNLSTTDHYVKFQLCNLYERYGVSSRFFVNKTPIADSSESLFLIDNEDVLHSLYEGSAADMLTFYGYYEIVDSDKTKASLSEMDEYFDTDDKSIKVCINRGKFNAYMRTFIPVDFDVVKYDDNTRSYSLVTPVHPQIVVQDVSNLHAYKEVDVSSMCTYSNSPMLYKIGDDGQSKGFARNSPEGNNITVRNLSEYNSYFNKYIYRTTYLISTPYTPPSYLTENRSAVIFIVVLAAAAALITALVAAFIRYTQDKSVYEIVEYRRKTTNAMAHDLKTPLAAISAYAENLEKDINTDKREYYSSRIVENVGIMNRMIEDILSFSRSEKRSGAVSKERVSVTDIIYELAGETEALFKASDSSLIVNVTDGFELNTDRSLLKQALHNLIANAARYTVRGLPVNADIKGNRIIITNHTDLITDNVDQLKEPFVKGQSSRTTGGTGLGLSIADNDLSMLGYKLLLSCDDGIFTATVCT